MLSYWFSAPVSYWWPLALAIGFALLGVVVVYLTLRRREEEPDATRIATLYGVGFGLAALTEFMMYLDAAFGWSLAAVFALSSGVVTIFAIAAIAVALVAIGVAVLTQRREESSFRVAHAHGYSPR